MAPLISVIAGEEWGHSSRGTGEKERGDHSCLPRWFLNQELQEGLVVGSLRRHSSWKYAGSKLGQLAGGMRDAGVFSVALPLVTFCLGTKGL